MKCLEVNFYFIIIGRVGLVFKIKLKTAFGFYPGTKRLQAQTFCIYKLNFLRIQEIV